MAVAFDKLPRNIEAEKATLGTMLSSRVAKDDALSLLSVNDFYLDIHKKVYEAIYNSNGKNTVVDIQTVTEELKNMKCLDEVGGTDYLYELIQSSLTPDNITEYVDIVKSNANLRELLLTFGEIEKEYLTQQIDSFTEFVGKAQARIDKVAEQRKISNFANSSTIVQDLKKRVYELAEKHKDKSLTGLNTGFTRLNSISSGLQNQNLIIIAGRPGMGKTALALNIALNAAMYDDVPVGIFEMEMSSVTLYSRLVSNLSHIESQKIINGRLDVNQRASFTQNCDKLSKLKIFVDESPSLTILDLAAKARKLKAEQPNLSLLVIDYLGLITSDNKRSNKRYDSRQLEIQEYTRTLHELARDLNIPIILLCQLNRKVEDRGEGGKPRLSDLRESGSIEQDAEIVLLLYKEDMKKNQDDENTNFNDKAKAAHMSPEARHQMLEHIENRVAKENGGNEQRKKTSPYIKLFVAKNRNGAADIDLDFMFLRQYSKFEEVKEDFEQRKQKLEDKYSEEEWNFIYFLVVQKVMLLYL